MTAGFLHAGRIGRPHGLDGSFHVTRPVPSLLEVGVKLRVGGDVRRIVRRSGTEDRPILRVSGVEDRTAVEALRGTDLLVPRAAAPPLERDEYWADDLVGCRVLVGERELGVVERMLALPSCEVLEVSGGTLVPMVRDAIAAVDVAGREIRVHGEFLGLDDPAPAEDSPRPVPPEDSLRP